MKINKEIQNNIDNEVYFTQKELAQRWRVTEATIKNIRDIGGIPFFLPPNSSRVLYPIGDIVELEQEGLTSTNKEERKRKKPTESKRNKPVNPTKSTMEWRI